MTKEPLSNEDFQKKMNRIRQKAAKRMKKEQQKAKKKLAEWLSQFNLENFDERIEQHIVEVKKSIEEIIDLEVEFRTLLDTARRHGLWALKSLLQELEEKYISSVKTAKQNCDQKIAQLEIDFREATLKPQDRQQLQILITGFKQIQQAQLVSLEKQIEQHLL